MIHNVASQNDVKVLNNDLTQLSGSISDEYDLNITYAPNDPDKPAYCIDNNILWKNKVQCQGIAPEEGIYWTAVTVGEEIASINSRLLRKLLWTNPTPSSSFSPQTLDTDFSGYTMIQIFAMRSANEPSRLFSVQFPVGYSYGAEINRYSSGIETSRIAQFTNTNKLQFNNGYMGDNVDDTQLIPYKIYGIL